MKIAVMVDKFPCRSETFISNQITGMIDRGYDVDIYANSGEDVTGNHGHLEEYDVGRRTFYFQDDMRWMPANKLRRLVRAGDLFQKSWKMGKLGLLKSLNFVKFGKSAASLELLYKGMAFATKGPYDLVHCHFGQTGLIASVLKDIGAFQGKVITTFYGYDISNYIREQGLNAYNFLFAHGDLFIAISQKMREDLIRLGCNKDKIVIHRLGVDLARFAFRPPKVRIDGKVRILTVGRFIQKKGLEYGIRAVAEVLKKYPEIEYNIVGDGELRGAMTQLIARLNVGKHIHLLGWRTPEDVANLMKEADIFLAPSMMSGNGDQEGTPTVIIEALARGLPVLSTFHSGIPELVQDGHSGFLVPEEDTTALAERLEFMVKHPRRWEDMGRAGRAWVERNCDINRLNDRLVELCKGVIDGEFEVKGAA